MKRRGLVARGAAALSLTSVLIFAACSINACSSSTSSSGVSSNGGNGPGDSGPETDAAIAGPCKLPGSIQFLEGGTHVVPGGKSGGPDLSFLRLPKGFCAHYFGTVDNARQLRFAPGGELFVASPTRTTTGGGAGGKSAIMVLADDNHDGYADSVTTFLDDLPATQGMMFANGHFYYQNLTRILRVPYASGDRKPSGESEVVVNITAFDAGQGVHWPKTFDIADDGTIYAGNGGSQEETCIASHPFHGGVLKVDGTPGGAKVAKGLRNPIAIRCARGKNQCFAVELAKDFSSGEGGREKIVPIRQGDDWGFPCCATKGKHYAGNDEACDDIAPENVSFLIGDTPFGIAFEQSGKWPAEWANHAFVPLHGAAGTWTGTRLVAIAMNPETGGLETGSTVAGHDQGATVDFATGFDDNTFSHGRPAAVEFSTDGRLFLSSDADGTIIWIAPLSL